MFVERGGIVRGVKSFKWCIIDLCRFILCHVRITTLAWTYFVCSNNLAINQGIIFTKKPIKMVFNCKV